MNEFFLSPLFQKNKELSDEVKEIKKFNLKLSILSIVMVISTILACIVITKNLVEKNNILYESSTLSAAVSKANDIVSKAQITAADNQQEAESEASSILAAAEEEASKIIKDAKEN